MKITHIIDSNGMYGAEVMLLNLMEEQAKLGHEPVLLSIEGSEVGGFSLAGEAAKKGLKAVKLEVRKGFSIEGIRSIIKISKENNTDIIHSHGYKGNILIGAVPRFIRKIPAISTIHGWTAVTRLSKIWLYTILDKFFLKRLEAIVFVNPLNTIHIRHSSAFCVENGIPSIKCDPDSIVSDDQYLYKFKEKDIYCIGCISRLSEEKGIGILIDSVVALNKRGIDFRLVIIGDGELYQELRAKVSKLGIENNVCFTGYRKYAYNYLPLFDVFVLPSLTEGLPITILEAMQAKVPIIATRVGAIPGVLDSGNSGMIVEPGNIDALANALINVWECPEEAKNRASKASIDVSRRYSSDRMAEDYIKIYHAVLKKWKYQK